MSMIQRRWLTATSLILLSTASHAMEPDQRALELALSLSAQSPAVAQKNAAALAAAALATPAVVGVELARLVSDAQQQGEK